MALTNQQYDLITRKYEEIRLRHKHELDDRRAKIETRIPEYKELDKELISMSMEYGRKSLTLGQSQEQKKKAMDEYHARMLDIRLKKNKLLESYGFNKDYLEMEYDCIDCKDTGYVDGEKCSCFKRYEVEFLYDSSHLKELLEVNNFNNLSYDYYLSEQSLKYFENAVTTCKNFVNNFNSDYHNLFIYGTVGTGKSFLSGCVAKELMDRGCTVVYFSAVNLFQSILNLSYDKDKGPLNALYNVLFDSDLLIIDDLGTEQISEFVKSQIFSIVSERILRRKSIIISTNCKLEEFKVRYLDRLYSRLFESFELIPLITDKDIRMLKKPLDE